MSTKLSDAQIRCLETMQYGTRPLPLSAKAETQRMSKLIKMGLVGTNHGEYCPEYFLTLMGSDVLSAMTVIEAPAEDETIAAELPAAQESVEATADSDRTLLLMGCSGPADNDNLTGREDLTCGNCGQMWVSSDFFDDPDYDWKMCDCGMTLHKSDLKTGFAVAVNEYEVPPAPTMKDSLIAAKDAYIAQLEAALHAAEMAHDAAKVHIETLEAQSERRETLLSKHREFVRDMCGYSFSDQDDRRFVSDCVDELERN